MEHRRYTHRTVEWGHWGITFLDVQPDRSKNFGVIAGYIGFAIGPRGPVDGTAGSDLRNNYKHICRAWTEDGALPEAA